MIGRFARDLDIFGLKSIVFFRFSPGSSTHGVIFFCRYAGRYCVFSSASSPGVSRNFTTMV
jgi:hypothetical protein